MNKQLEDIISDFIEFFRPHIEGVESVLDIGTGSSIPIHVFAEHFPEIKYDTVDIVDIRKRKTLPFKIYNGSQLPFGNSVFDVSVLNETLHHCKDPLTVLAEARRVSKSVFVIEHFPCRGTDIKKLIKTEEKALRDFNIECSFYKPFTEHSLCLLFEKAGLDILDQIEVPYQGIREIRKYFFKLE